MNFYTNVYYNYSSVLISERRKDGTKDFREEPFVPSVYIPTNKKTNKKSIKGQPLGEMTFDSYSSYKEFLEKYQAIPDFEIHGDIQSEYQFINKRYGTKINYDFSKIDILYFDIETSSEAGFPSIESPEEEVIAISLTSTLHGKATFCLGVFTSKDPDVKVFEFQDEVSLLKSFLHYFTKNYPDILSGWSIRFFDIPYLVNRITKVLGAKYAKQLSPWGKIKDKIIDRNGREEKVYDLVGISILDYYEVYKTFTYTNQESYSLNHISYVELGEKKLSYSEFESITEFYKKDFQKFIEYNIRDVELVVKLENKLRLIELAVALAYSAGVNFQDVFSQVRTWDVIIYNYLSEKNIIIPPKRKAKSDDYPGAYVKEPVPGMYKWVLSFDLNSLYPHLIMQYNISPETITSDGSRGMISPDAVLRNGPVATKYIEEFTEKDLSIAANGTTYRKDIRGFLGELMDNMYKDRKMFKNKMLDAKKDLEAINAELKRRGLTT